MQKPNKKIRNAIVCKGSDVFSHITFRSQLEKHSYAYLQEQGLNPQYEPKQFTIWPGFEPKTPFYDVESDNQYEKRGATGGKQLVLKDSKLIGLRYTPDIYCKIGNLDVWIELKSIENDCFYIKKKMFRYYLDKQEEATGQKSIYFEVHNRKQLKQAIEIAKEYAENIDNL